MESPFVYNPQLVFINLFLFIILTINIRKIWNYRIKRNSKSQKGYLFLFIFASLYSVFNFSEGDFYSYADLFYWGNRTNDFEYLESRYQYIVYNITYNYLQMNHNIPCGKDMYYDRRKRFYWLLSQRI